MANTQRMALSALMSQIEELWADLDVLFDSMTPADWQRPHGKDWTFADVPYHLMYFDRDILDAPLEYLENLPPDRQLLLTPSNVAEWNARSGRCDIGAFEYSPNALLLPLIRR